MTATIVLAALCALHAEDKPSPRPEPPVVLMADPFGIEPGARAKVLIRGLRLDEITGARVAVGGADTPPAALAGTTITVLEKAKSPPPAGVAPGRAGDTRAVLEILVPERTTARTIEWIVTSPAGDSRAFSLRIDRPGSIVGETEPNDGFQSASDLPLGSLLQGRIAGPRDVDVYRARLEQGQEYTIEVLAERVGSAFDPLVTVYDARGESLASLDDDAGSLDPTLTFRPPASGTYFVVMQDANDLGGETHPYRLRVGVQRLASF